MARYGLITLGLVIAIGTFLFANVLLSPTQANRIKTANSACNSFLGNVFGSVNEQAARDCKKATFLGTILNLEPLIYIFGIILIIIGAASGGKEKVVERVVEKPVQREMESIKKDKGTQSSSKFPKSVNEDQKESEKIKYCTNCGSEVKEGVNYCPECGEEIK